MINNDIEKMVEILSTFLGEPKSRECGDSYQFQFPCPRCIEKEGESESSKNNLEVNIKSSVFNCWKCSSSGDDEMKGKISKLFKLYGNEELWDAYKECLNNIRNSELFLIDFSKGDFGTNDSEDLKKAIDFPETYHLFSKNSQKLGNIQGLKYLKERGIGWDIIQKYKMGYTDWSSTNPMQSNRIIIPSFNKFDELNYWVGRDFTGKSKMKYWNAKAEKKDIIFNENLINWNADVNLVEGPFDYIAVNLNSIPLLGKALTPDFRIYQQIFEKANANINIFLDGDAKATAYHLYKTLNQGRMYNRIRYVPLPKDLDPSDIQKEWGKKGIIEFLKSTVKLKEAFL